MANVQSFSPAPSPEDTHPSEHPGLPDHLSRPEDEVFDLEPAEHLDAERLESELTLLLDRFPDAPVAAFVESGLFAEMPDSIKLKNNTVLGGRWAMGREGGEDRDAVFTMWERVRKHGAARCLIHPAAYQAEIVFYTLDLRERHGVILGVFVPTGAPSSSAPPPSEVAAAPPPRFATVHKDNVSTILSVDEALTQILGWSAEDMEGRRQLDFIHPDDHGLAIDNWMQMLALSGPGRRVRLRHRTKDDNWVWFELTNHNLLADPEHGCVISEMVDISDEMAAQETLRAREQLLDRLAETVPVGLFQLDADRRIVYVNDRLREILGVDSATTVDAQLATVVPSDRAALEQAIDSVLGEGLDTDTEVQLRPPGDELHFCTISLRPLSHEDGTISGAIACVVDVTDGARMREELKLRATFDELTGCYNRASILRALEANVASGRRHADRAVMFLDLDSFKEVNDRYGHAAGDELLRVVAERLRGALRDEDLVGRIGGDEFLVVCPDIGGPEPAMKLAGRLADALREGVSAGVEGIGYQVSVGVVWSSGSATDADTLVARADRAMYESKRERTGSPKLAGTSSPGDAPVVERSRARTAGR